jgi:RES domain
MFYGAMDCETAIMETFQPEREDAINKNVSIAQFQTLRILRILDLTNLPEIPSIFDVERCDLIDGIGFLHEFVDDLAQPIERDGREHIDYERTEIVTEFFRHQFRTPIGVRLDGIFYRSSKRPEGTACVLFIDAHNCGVSAKYLRNTEQILRLRLVHDATVTFDGAGIGGFFDAHRARIISDRRFRPAAVIPPFSTATTVPFALFAHRRR